MQIEDLSYANLAWGATHPSKLVKLSSLQKHYCKAIVYKKRCDSAAPVFINMNFLNLENLNIYKTLILMYKYKNKLLSNFEDFFQKPTRSKYTLRSTTHEMLSLPINSCKHIEHSLLYRGPKLWNNLDNEIKNILSLNTFKKRLKYLLVQKSS